MALATRQSHQSLLHIVPGGLIAIRLACGPLLLLASLSSLSLAVLATLSIAMLSDIFDGVIARRLKIATEKLRVADSWADATFFLFVGLSAWFADRGVLNAYAFPLLAELALQVASYLYDLIRYRRISSLHAYSAKIWGFTLYLAAGGVLAFHYGGLIWLAFGFGLVSGLDALAIKLILPGWHHDVLSAFHAYRQSKVGS